VASGQGHGDRVPGYGAAGAAFPNFGGPVPGEQQDVREDNAWVNPEVTRKRRSPVNKRS
jgi:hypothetical protein